MASTEDRKRAARIPPGAVSLDLELGVRDGRLHAVAAVRQDTGEVFRADGRDLATTLDALDAFVAGARYLVGHNLAAFDLPKLRALRPGLRLLGLPFVDTLRLNPLAFPRNPYHHLVKHYQDGQLLRDRLNDPELDARLALGLLGDQVRALATVEPDLLLAWHALVSEDPGSAILDELFTGLRGCPRPGAAEVRAALARFLAGRACRAGMPEAAAPWPLAFALAWLSVAGGNSVLPPWVCHQFPETEALVQRLRGRGCGDAECSWCAEHHDAERELARWFRFPAFRARPAAADGRSLQGGIVTAALGGGHVLGILPTGTGKSLCYQVPALSRYHNTGALTLVISPLVALMADQVAGLEIRGITCCAALNGLLSMPERADVLERVRLGDVGILIVSPEQLRSRTFRKVIQQRRIGSWVLDEAHCLSKWGHDFRPDYRYVGRFIRERAGSGPVPPVLCLTATAKPDVLAEIVEYFRASLGIELQVFDGGAERDNLAFEVVPTTPGEKLSRLFQVLREGLPPEQPGGAIVYCSTRRRTEEVAAALAEKGWQAGHFHAGLTPESKKSVQTRFIQGDLRVIAATNAFGMGIDKPDVRLVVHADIPGSLENYLQEAGRAGRDQQAARCVLLYTPEDVERQFALSASSRLSRREIQAILRTLRNLHRRGRAGADLVVTSGELLAEEDEGAFVRRDLASDDTRVRTALAWLEESGLLTREENRVQVFPSSLRVASVADARSRLESQREPYRGQLLRLVESLVRARPDEGVSTDELMGASGLDGERLRAALHDLERLGIASNDTALTAFVHAGVERSSDKRLRAAASLEAALLEDLEAHAPDLGKGEESFLHLRVACQRLKDAGHPEALPETLWLLLRGLAADGREGSGLGSLRLRRLDPDTLALTLQRDWPALRRTAELRRGAAERLLEHLLASLPPQSRGVDLLAQTTLGKLRAALEADLFLRAEARDLGRLLDRSLMWLHEQEVLRLNKGLAVFRPAMTIRLGEGRRNFLKEHFQPLEQHYREQVCQIHVVAEYAQRGLAAMAEALALVMDYFARSRDAFLDCWLPGREAEWTRQTTPESWHDIVESLKDPVQAAIVTGDGEANRLVLAGPGSGKTRVLVHRIAYLVRVRREDPRGILALAYNRHAAVEIRRRLEGLIGQDARQVAVLTCHALAMRLAGFSFRERAAALEEDTFRAVLRAAAALLRGDGLAPEEADAFRARLLGRFRWILVDEYQDIGPDQYDLVSALAGRTLADPEARLGLFAAGDDDQNIYGFQGASVAFIRRFGRDYQAERSYLTGNYRSTAHIIAAANRVIAPARERMKRDHPITVDPARAADPPGGTWQGLDPVAQGRVQLLPAGTGPESQAMAVMAELCRLAALDPAWDWTRAAVLAREWEWLEPVRSWCGWAGIPARLAREDGHGFWRLRETQALLNWIEARDTRLVDAGTLRAWAGAQGSNPWGGLLQEALDTYEREEGAGEHPAASFVEWLAEWGRDLRRRPSGLTLASAHRAKGMEFDHVAVLDGGWERMGPGEDPDAARRLYYVAMTRARRNLILARLERGNPLLAAAFGGNGAEPFLLRRPAPRGGPIPPEIHRRHLRPPLKDLDLGFAGRREPGDRVHAALRRLEPDAPLRVHVAGARWLLLDAGGTPVGRLAASFRPPPGMTVRSAKVAAILVRRKQDGEAEFSRWARCAAWELVVPDLEFEPLTAEDPAQTPFRRPGIPETGS